MALKPQGNNILAGTALAIAQIQSPDYVAGVSGWCIFQNGNAEFNSGTFRGYIVGGSLFIYNGTPGVGTLVASVTSLTSDPFGNTTQPGGLTVYNASAYAQLHINATVDAPALEMVTGVVSEADHAALYTVPENTGMVNESMTETLLGPGSTFDGVQAFVGLFSANKDGSSGAGGALGRFVSGTGVNAAIWDVNGFRGPDTWHAMSPLTGFAAGAQTPEYRLGLDRRVWLRGSISLTGTHAANTAFWTCPAGYAPAVNQFYATPNSLGSYATGGVSALITATNAQTGAAGVNGNFITLDGISYTLDS